MKRLTLATTAARMVQQPPDAPRRNATETEACRHCGTLLLFTTDMLTGYALEECPTCGTGPRRIMPYHPPTG